MQGKQVHYGSHVIQLANMEMCGKAVMHQPGVSHYTNVSTLRGAYPFQIATGRFYHIHHSASLLWRYVSFHHASLLLSWQLLNSRSKLMNSTCDVSISMRVPHDAYLLMMRPNSPNVWPYRSPLDTQ